MLVHPEAVDHDAVDGTFFWIEVIRAHEELAAGDPHHVLGRGRPGRSNGRLLEFHCPGCVRFDSAAHGTEHRLVGLPNPLATLLKKSPEYKLAKSSGINTFSGEAVPALAPMARRRLGSSAAAGLGRR